MILFVGQVGNDFYEREAFQEIDYRRMFGQMAKWVAQIDRTDRIPEFIARAFAVATSGRPGPVVLALPEDTLWGKATVPDMPRYVRSHAAPAPHALASLTAMLEQAERPFLMIGGSGWTPEAMRQMEGFAERFGLPVGLAFMGAAYSEPDLVGFGFALERKLQARRPPQFKPTLELK